MTVDLRRIGQQRKECLSFTQQVSDGKVHEFYEQIKEQNMAGFYILKGHNAYIHPMGIVGKACGYYQGISSVHF